MLLNDYLNAPCRSSSIPYWKQKIIKVPNDTIILHDSEYDVDDFVGYIDEPYFRLYHDLKSIRLTDRDEVNVIVANADMLDLFVKIINECYDDLSVSKDQMENYRKTPVYSPDLWVLLKDKTGTFIGCGIADFDREVGEMILEWIQVVPSCRGQGYGQIIVNYLLSKMQGKARFATVSGRVNNATNPEKLYRKCGFVGNDIWHVLRKSDKV